MADEMARFEAFKIFRESISEFEANLSAAFSIIAEEMRESVLPAIKQIYDMIYQAYIADGAIYGETPDGCHRWLHEIAEIQRLRAEANYLEQRQQAVAEFKQLVAKKVAR